MAFGFGNTVATASVKITADTSAMASGLKGAESRFKSFTSGVGGSIKSVNSHLATLGKVGGLVGVTAGIFAVKNAWDELSSSMEANAQTAAVIKSTGDVSNVTKKSVQDLASAIQSYSGIDDEAVQSGENMLLTFTNIRNEAGKGNDIFNQSTSILADMSTALGVDMKTQAIQLGKALNDPIKGVSALQRVGVTFTDGQKAQIAAMVQSGNTMGAQKLILGELNKEFGGSAAAAGKTLPGQLKILRGEFDNLSAALLQKVIPYLTRFSMWVQKFVKSDQFKAWVAKARSAFETLQRVFQKVMAFIMRHQNTFKEIGIAVGIAAAAFIGLSVAIGIAAGVFALLTSPVLIVIAVAAAIIYCYRNFQTFRNVVKGVANAVVGIIKYVAQVFTTFISLVNNIIHGRWRAAWNDLKTLARLALVAMLAIIKIEFFKIPMLIASVIGAALGAMRRLGTGMTNALVGIVKAIPGKVGDLLRAIPGAVRSVIGAAGSAAAAIGSRIKSALTGALSGLGSGLSGIVKGAINTLIDAVNSGLNAIASHWPDAPGLPGPPGFLSSGIPHVKSGGLLGARSAYFVGEHGPELFIPSSSGRLVPNHQMNDWSGGGTTNINVSVHSFHPSDATTIKKIGDATLKALDMAASQRMPSNYNVSVSI